MPQRAGPCDVRDEVRPERGGPAQAAANSSMGGWDVRVVECAEGHAGEDTAAGLRHPDPRGRTRGERPNTTRIRAWHGYVY